MMPMIAGPPYAVAPTLRKLTAISFQFRASVSGIEPYLRPAPEGAGVPVDGDRRSNVLQSSPTAIEHRDLVVSCAARPAAADHVGKLGMHPIAREQPGGEGVLQLADLGALLEDVDDQGRGGDEPRLELLLALAVRADRGNESAWQDIPRGQERVTRRRAGDAHVALTKRGPKVLRGLDAQTMARRGVSGQMLRPRMVGVEHPGTLQRQD